MSDLFKYIEKYGEYSFSELSLNEVDIALFTKLSYLKYENFNIDYQKEYNLMSFLNKKNNIERLTTLKKANLKQEDEIVKANRTLLKLIKNKERYKNLYFTKFEFIKDLEKEEQFASITFINKEKEFKYLFVTFRGTDSSLVGWKEDLNLSYKRVIPSEKDSLIYLKKMLDIYKDNYKVYVLGHSKGGNLALYSASSIDKNYQDYISYVYDFDGPGNLSYFYKKRGYNNIIKKTIKYVPESSVIGRLLENKELKNKIYKYYIVKSDKSGLYQHNVLNWKIKDFKFIKLDDVNDFSKTIKNIFDDWLKKCNYKEREIFVNSFYEVVLNSDAKRIQDLVKTKEQIKKLYLNIKDLDEDIKKEVLLTLKFLKEICADDIISYLKNRFPSKIKSINFKEIIANSKNKSKQ